MNNLEERNVIINGKNKCVSNSITTSKYFLLIISLNRYNIITFLPISIYEQFRKLANIYFLFIVVLMSYGSYVKGSFFKSPLEPYSTLGPLIIVVGLTMVKELLEDISRHNSDKEINHKTVEKLCGDRKENILWKDIKTGDILKLYENDEIPADMVMFFSSDKSIFVL